MRAPGPLLLLLACACSGGNSLETTGAFSTLAPTTGGAGDTDGSTDSGTTPTPGSETSEVTTDLPTTGPGASTGTEETSSSTSTGPMAESSTGEPLPPQPETSWWSHCIGNDDCTDDLVCMLNGDGDDGVCTSQCSPPGDATSCGASPGGTTTGTCLNVGSASICALNCAGGLSCPGGMLCLSDTDDDGPIEICL